MKAVNLAHGCVTEDVNGPGRRFTLWVRGCSRRCRGCFNPALWASEPRSEVDLAALVRLIERAGPIDGLSFSGGEPFEQAVALTALVDAARDRSGQAELSLVVFTGYTREEILAGPGPWRSLFERVDLLVDGPYREREARALPLRGSANQRLLALTRRGAELLARAEHSAPGRFDLTVTGAGEVICTGFPPGDLVERISRRLGDRDGGGGVRFCPVGDEERPPQETEAT